MFEAGKTYRTRGGGEFTVLEVSERLFGKHRGPHSLEWEAEARWLDGRIRKSAPSNYDLLPPEPPIPPVVVSDAMWDTWNKAGTLPTGLVGVIGSFLREHPHALTGYRRDCAEREGGE